MPRSIAGINRASNSERLVETVVVVPDKVPAAGKHRPGKRWITARLKISTSSSIALVRKQQATERAKNQNAGANRGMEGLSWPGDELWMHIAPSEAEMRKHGVLDEHTRETEGKGEANNPSAIGSGTRFKSRSQAKSVDRRKSPISLRSRNNKHLRHKVKQRVWDLPLHKTGTKQSRLEACHRGGKSGKGLVCYVSTRPVKSL